MRNERRNEHGSVRILGCTHNRVQYMAHNWNTTNLDSEADVLDVLIELRGKRWLCRGQPEPWGNLIPKIDRSPRENLSRAKKLRLERQSIDIFQSTARFFAGPGEQKALADDITTLMVLRNYGVPTRLLDWSRSPYVAAYFSVCNSGSENGEIWSFDEPRYEQLGGHQWKKWPETTTDGSGEGPRFDPRLTAFTIDEPPDWFACFFYPSDFPRQNAQGGVYSLTARFGRDHADAIATLLTESSHYHRYVVNATLKPALCDVLREKHGIWRGSLFPDSAGAAETVHREVFPD